jgi:hypothetical protein
MKTKTRPRQDKCAAVTFGLPLIAAALLVLGTLASACGSSKAPATRRSTQAPAPASPTSRPAPTATASLAPSKTPTVYLLGGSSARESVISKAAWAAQIKQFGGGTVRTFDLGSTNQSYARDAHLVAAMPPGPALVLIGMTVGRYTGTAADDTAGLATYDARAALAAAAGGEIVHQYTVSKTKSGTRQRTMLPTSKKLVLRNRWLTERYPLFRANYAYNAGQLAKLIQECQKRGFHPVLLVLPVNLALIGHALDAPMARYRGDGRKLATKYGIPFVDFVAQAGLANHDFYDLFHLVEPGRVKWQARLSHEVVALLGQYTLTK